MFVRIIACSLSFTVYGVVFTPYDDPCDNDTVLVGNTTGYKAIADQMNGIINFSVTELKSGGKSGSKAIDQAKNLYKNCVKSLNDKKGTSGKQVMAAILSYGEFPTISKSQNTSIGDFDLTKLLVHFNRNRTVTPFLVPTVGLNKFNTSENIIKISLINGDIKGGTLNSSIVESDITDVLKFESKAESIFSSLSEIHQDPSSAKKAQLHRLSKVDEELKVMSWKRYLLLITPTELHKYIKADPVISVPSLDHIKRLNKLVLETKKRTLTNYVMLQHIKSLISMLQKKYNDAIDDFLTKSGQQKPTTEERCIALVRQKMPQVVGAVYVREVSEEEIKVAVDEIVAGIVEEFKRTLMNNIWMNNETKKAVLLKVDRMDRMVAYSDVLLDNKKLDDIHEHLLLAKPPPFLDMVDKMDNALSQDEFKSLLRNASRLNVYADMSSFDIYYDPSLNKLGECNSNSHRRVCVKQKKHRRYYASIPAEVSADAIQSV
ncbi:peptidase family M13 [Necator americanus]|uniref:Peptidase family M13 n=1 Tax=Necator americanus TaxID=51031 RepID=W2ST95_NECAM|nr:peptidase family M13 [Necator americanus]ETN72974.1 peptidase family M13 [Necator americanus]